MFHETRVMQMMRQASDDGERDTFDNPSFWLTERRDSQAKAAEVQTAFFASDV